MSNNQYLTGKCLIAMPQLQDERFANSVIYICSHTENGAMGFVLNKKIKDFSFADLARQLPVANINPALPIELHQGGPLEKVRGFVLHSTDYIKEDTVLIDDKMAVSSSIDIITDIAFGIGPKDSLIALGYASWAPKQLEQEIVANSWMVVQPSTELVFHTKDEDKWQKAMDALGIDVGRLSEFCGRA